MLGRYGVNEIQINQFHITEGIAKEIYSWGGSRAIYGIFELRWLDGDVTVGRDFGKARKTQDILLQAEKVERDMLKLIAGKQIVFQWSKFVLSPVI
jgi:hypothetical protein